MRYFLLTLGCQMNLSDSERIHSVLKEMGFTQTDVEDEADLIGVIACSVRQKAIDKVYNKIAHWNREKNHRNILTFISGCILPSDKQRFLKLFDIVFPMSEVHTFPELISSNGIVTPASLEISQAGIPTNKNIFSLWDIAPDYQSEYEAFVPIQNGCDKFCTFCAVPYTRGSEVSRPSEEILTQVKDLIEKGYKSITLLGQNVNSYGLDRGGKEIEFSKLLEKVGELGLASGKDFWVYYTSPHPRDMTKEVINAMAKYPHIAKQVHLPLQSGDDKILVKMNRKHSVERYSEIVDYIREKLPEATLFTDIIVGFTGESDSQFENTVQAMRKFAYNMAYIAQYSPRPGAASFRWDDTVPLQTKKDRYHILSEILIETASLSNEKLVGKTLKVLVTGPDRKPGFFKGLTEGKINIRFQASQWSLIGHIIEVKVTSSSGLSLQGEMAPVVITEMAID